MKRVVVGSIVCMLLLVPSHQAYGGASGDPDGIPDAACPYVDAMFGGFTPYWAGSQSTQSFVAMRTGKILAARAYQTFRSQGSDGTAGITMDIVDVDVNGQPQGEPLGSTTIDGAAVPINAWYDPTGTFERSTAPKLVEGQSYGLRLSTNDNVQNVWSFMSGNPCSNGRSNSDSTWDHSFEIWLVNRPPVIKNVRPRPASKIEARRPVVSAKVRDSVTDLRKSNIVLFLDGQQKDGFDYKRLTDELTFKTPRLALGPHRVEIRATDLQGKSTTREWGFKVVR